MTTTKSNWHKCQTQTKIVEMKFRHFADNLKEKNYAKGTVVWNIRFESVTHSTFKQARTLSGKC